VISSPKVRAFMMALGRSKRMILLRALLGGRKRMARTKATMPRGTLIKNSHCHEARERIAAAIVGPAAEETATTKELMPMPRPRKRCG
jgi:hypothetical protein